MRLLVPALLGGLMAAAPAASDDRKEDGRKQHAASEKALREFGEFRIGGAWVTNHPDGKLVFEERFEWVFDKRFLKSSWHDGTDTGITIIGVDPATGKLAGWGFDDKGRLWPTVGTIEKENQLTFTGTGHSKGGRCSWKSSESRIGPDKARLIIFENVVDGKSFSTGEFTSVRKKEAKDADPAKKAAPRDRTAAEKAFKEWGDFLVGGVWVTTGTDGNAGQERFEWVLGESFLMLEWKYGKAGTLSFAGIDPKTGKLACWEFDDEGRVWKGTVTIDKDEWTWSSEGDGVNGRSAWKSRSKRVGPDEGRSEILEDVIDGKKQPTKTITGKRKR